MVSGNRLLKQDILVNKRFNVAMGYQAGMDGQGGYSVAVGNQAGCSGQASQAIAIGSQAGGENQKNIWCSHGFSSRTI